jgi:hypothetical protein
VAAAPVLFVIGVVAFRSGARPEQRLGPRRHWSGPDAARAPHSARHVGSNRAGTRCSASVQRYNWINLECIGDIVDENPCEVAAKKIKRKPQCSDNGVTEQTRTRQLRDGLCRVHVPVTSTRHAKLISEKAALRTAEWQRRSVISTSSTDAIIGRQQNGIATVACEPIVEVHCERHLEPFRPAHVRHAMRQENHPGRPLRHAQELAGLTVWRPRRTAFKATALPSGKSSICCER